MPMETSAVGIRPVGRPAAPGGAEGVSRRGGESTPSGFRPQTNVAIENAIDDMAGILTKIASEEAETVDKMPQDLRKVIENVMRQAFSFDETIGSGLGSTMESQRFSMEQLTTVARTLLQMSALAEKGYDVGISDGLQKLLAQLKLSVTQEPGGQALEPVLLLKEAFGLINGKSTSELPPALQQLFVSMQAGGEGQPLPSASLQFLKALVQSFMPKSGQAFQNPALQSPGSQGKAFQGQAAAGQMQGRAMTGNAPQSAFQSQGQTFAGTSAQPGMQGQAFAGTPAQPGMQGQAFAGTPTQPGAQGQAFAGTPTQPGAQGQAFAGLAMQGQAPQAPASPGTAQQGAVQQGAAPQGPAQQGAAQGQPLAGQTLQEPGMQPPAQGPTVPNQTQGQMQEPTLQNAGQGQMPEPAFQNPTQGQLQEPTLQNSPQGQMQSPMPQNALQGQLQEPMFQNSSQGQLPTSQNPAQGQTLPGQNAQGQMPPGQMQGQSLPSQVQGQPPLGQMFEEPMMQGQGQPPAGQAFAKAPAQGEPQLGQGLQTQGQAFARPQGPMPQGAPVPGQAGQTLPGEQPFGAAPDGSRLPNSQAAGDPQAMAWRPQPQKPPASLTAREAKEILMQQPLQNTPETMQTMKDLARLFLEKGNLPPQDAQMLQTFADGKDTALPVKEARKLETLLRLVQQNIPATVQQAAVQNDLPELSRLWAFMQLCDLAVAKKLTPRQLKKASKDVVEFIFSMRSSMEGDHAIQPGQRSMNFMMPMYLGENEKSYPAYVHVYDETKPDKETGALKKETWLRLCVLTEHLGAVELTCRVYEREHLDLRLSFASRDTAQEFHSFVPELRKSMRGSKLRLEEVAIRAPGV